MCLVASSVNRSDVNDLFPGRVRKTSSRKTEQTKPNQDHPKRLVHTASFGGDSWQCRSNLTIVSFLKRSHVHCAETDSLLLEHLFNLADFLLDFAGEIFVLAFGRKGGVVRDLSRFLFNFSFQFVKLAFDLIRRARFHASSCAHRAFNIKFS